MDTDQDPTCSPENWSALRNLVTLYCRGIDRRDMDLLRSVFHPDTQLDFGAGYFVGNEWRIIHRTAVQDWQSPAGKIYGINLGKLDRSDLSYAVLGL
jgi:hypothetical protein